MVVLGFLFFLSKGYFKGHGQEGKKYRHLQARKKKKKEKKKGVYFQIPTIKKVCLLPSLSIRALQKQVLLLLSHAHPTYLPRQGLDLETPP